MKQIALLGSTGSIGQRRLDAYLTVEKACARLLVQDFRIEACVQMFSVRSS